MLSKPNDKAMLIKTSQELKVITLESIPIRLEPTALLMCDPAYFEVKDVKNAFMSANINCVDSAKALKQWHALKNTFVALGVHVEVLASQPDLEDIVFTANQVLVGQNDLGQSYVVLSQMRFPSRQREVPLFRAWFQAQDYLILDLPNHKPPLYLEGHGDALWHPGKQLLWGGYGHRTEREAYQALSRLLEVPIIALHLVHPKYYHLDTAFCILDANSVMMFPPAFDTEGLKLIHHFFSHVIEVSEPDAENFACNAFAIG
ncbi:MAG: amidinotransferase, partial [Candidatus Melainabacteria bacterium]|nr:amidinotransferase [Candidatus Melainabacteria bacterium]